MISEYDSILKNDTWQLVERPEKKEGDRHQVGVESKV
jgi:uncharacterized membrane protein